jgi:rare lipoprotein A
MKKIYLILLILLVSVVIPFQLQAQSTDVFKQEGIASWYGREFEGRPTASGEIFDSSQLTAAHPSLPFGTRLIVTNQHNNKSVTVRVNDRGPFVPARIIDVSRAAAEHLDMIVTGTAPVSVVSIDRIVISNTAVGAYMASPAAPVVAAPVQPVLQQPIAAPVPVFAAPAQPAVQQPVAAPVQPAAPSAPTHVVSPVASTVFVTQPVIQPMPQVRLTPDLNIVPTKNYRLQIGSFRNARNAVEAFDRLKNTGLSPAYERFTSADNVEFYRVVVAGVPGSNVLATTERIGAAGFREAIIREEN